MVDKPAGLVVHPAPGTAATTLVDVLGDLLGGGEATRPGIVHRLDKDTSGLMLVARDEEAHRRARRDDQGARGRARTTWRWSRAACARARARSTRRSAATTARPSGGRSAGAGAARGAHPLRGPRGAARRHPRRRPPRDRPHAPDPRPLRRDRPPRRGRRPLRRGAAATGSSASSCTAPGSRFAHPFSGARARVHLASCPPDLAAALERARGGLSTSL